MGRYTKKSPTPRYMVVWDLQWTLIECQRLEPAADLSGAVAAIIDQSHTTMVSCLSGREAERKLLMLTPRDPQDTGAQSFSPFLHRPVEQVTPPGRYQDDPGERYANR